MQKLLLPEKPATDTENSTLFFEEGIISGSEPIYKFLKTLLSRFPQLFENDLLNEFYCFYVLSLPSFRKLRLERHIGRIILTQYRTRKEVKHALLLAPERRHLALRFLPTVLNNAFGKKSVLGVMLTISLSGHFECFGEEHLLYAIQKWIPDARLIQGSRYVYKHPEEEKMFTLYVEVCKEDGSFTLSEKRFLKKTLLQELKDHVQKLLPSIYNVRNEENIMKNMIILSQEIHDIHSLPQMMISFEKHTENALIFTIVLAYVSNQQIKEESFLDLKDPSIEISFERKQRVGYLECKTAKEALVLRAKVVKLPDLQRKDFSVDAYHARKKVQAAIQQAIGNARDYDGGLIQKQQELFSIFQCKFAKYAQEQSDLLEQFFYSITPIEKQATLPISVLETLFSFVLNSLSEDFSQKGSSFLRFYEDENYFYAFVRTEGSSFKQHLQLLLRQNSNLDHLLASSTFSFRETLCEAYLLESTDPIARLELKNTLNSALNKWKKERQDFQILRLNFVDHPFSLDPRMAGDETTKVILQLLFEGLMRYSDQGKPECALAESVKVSQDQKIYTFKLKKTMWSNGNMLEASDFEYAWKKILSPDFDTLFAHVFYCIKNAHPAKQGILPIDSVGVYALDSYTLQVELEYPVPYFLELLTQPLFSAVHQQTDINSPQWALSDGAAFICNGPFRLQRNQGDKGYTLEKNSWYWDKQTVSLNRVVLSKTNARTALEQFKQGKLDWLGRPMRLWESLFSLAKTEKSEYIHLKERVILCMLNTNSAPLNNLKIRQALALAVNRQEFIDNLEMSTAAFSPLHSNHTFYSDCGSLEGEIAYAQQVFQEAMRELKITKFPNFTLAAPDTEGWIKIASILKSQWERYLGITVVCQTYPWPTFVDTISKGNFMASLMSWFSWVNDPLYTLNAFKFSEVGINYPNWEHPDYQNLLNRASLEKNDKNRASQLARAEAILIKETPLISIIYEKEIALKEKQLDVPIYNGTVDFKKTRFSK